jgi:hypothetical protein
MNMNTPERFRRDEKPEITEEEQSQLDALEAAANAARDTGISDPERVEGEK